MNSELYLLAFCRIKVALSEAELIRAWCDSLGIYQSQAASFCYSESLEPPNQGAFQQAIANLEDFGDEDLRCLRQKFEDLAMKVPKRIQVTGMKPNEIGIGPNRFFFSVYARGDFTRSLWEIEDYFRNWLLESAAACFGKWGSVFFLACADELPDYCFELADVGVSQARGGHIRIADITINKSAFTVCLVNKPPLRLGNTDEFRFLCALIERVNTFVAHADLAELLGKDCLYAGPKVLKFRLAQKLRKGDYKSLANAIRSETGHYGLFLNDTEMKP